MKYASKKAPIGGWQFPKGDICPIAVQGISAADVAKQINSIRRSNRLPELPISELEQKVVDYVCQRQPPGWCTGGNQSAGPDMRLSATAVVNESMAFNRKLDPINDGKEQERLAICGACPEARHLTTCANCSGLTDIVEILRKRLVGSGATTGKGCKRTGLLCLIMANAGEAAARHLMKGMPPATCWAKFTEPVPAIKDEEKKEGQP